MLDAMKNKDKLLRSKSETNLKSPKGSVVEDGSISESSQSTRLIQEIHLSGQKLHENGSRPKSWSPDNFSAGELVSTIKSSPISISLEDLPQKTSLQDTVDVTSFQSETSKSTMARHVFCDNGESYSVSPNQIVHLPGHDSVTCRKHEKKNFVLRLATKFEFQSVQSSDEKIKETTWDPGEEGETTHSEPCGCKSTNDCDSDSRQKMWNSSVIIKTENFSDSNLSKKVPNSSNQLSKSMITLRGTSDPFSNHLDRVFDREEKKENRVSLIPVISSPELTTDEKSLSGIPSRQSSWSSYDSAMAMNFQDDLSRQSSWSSSDSRNMPSRNSSWGSYDMRNKEHPIFYINEKGEKIMHSKLELANSSSGIFPYDKSDIPWHPGTVKRSKQKLEQSSKNVSSNSSLLSSKTPSSETLLSDVSSELLVEAVNPILVNLGETPNSAISQKIDIPYSEKKNTSSSSRLSASAPEPSSMVLVSQDNVSRSASNVSSLDTVLTETSQVRIVF